MKELILERLNNKSATIGIIGLGYVGLPLALTYSQNGYKVIGIDTEVEKIQTLNSGKSFINHISDNEVTKSVETGFQATTDISSISKYLITEIL